MKTMDEEYKRKIEELEKRLEETDKKLEQARIKGALSGVETEDPAEDPENWKNIGKDSYEPKVRSFSPFFADVPATKGEFAERLLKALPLILCVLLFMWWFNSWANNKQESYDKANNMSAVTVETSVKSFTKTPDSAKKEYLEKRLKVSGKVTIQMSLNDSGCVTLDGGDYGLAYAYFDDTSKISSLSSGDTIMFTGELESYASVDLGTGKILYLYFYDCDFVR
jgi:hypothetical protein